MTANSILTVFVWLFWALIVLQTALALYGYAVERREGLAISRARLFGALGVFAVATALVLVMVLTLDISGPVARPAAGMNQATAAKLNEMQAQIEAKQHELEGIEKALQVLQEQKARLQGEPSADSGKSSRVLHWIGEIFTPGANAGTIGVLGVLLAAGLANLLLAGRVQTMFPRLSQLSGKKESARKLTEALDLMAAQINEKKYSEALEQSAQIQEKKLPPFELLDFLFLRAFASVQLVAFSRASRGAEENAKLLKQSIEDLEFVAEEAPRRYEAVYTLAVAHGLAESYAAALELFENTEENLATDKLPFEHNKSVCLLRLAELSLAAGDTAKAEAYYARVAGLAAFQGLIAHSRIAIAMIDLQTAVKREDFEGASAIVAKIEAFEHVDADQRAQIGVIRDALFARIALRQNDPRRALAISAKFLSDHLPSGLPAPADDVIDEAFSPILDADLPFSRDVFLGFCFVKAVSQAQLAAKSRTPLSEAQVAELAAPLLRGLQLVPRHRYFLGAIGGLYYWFKPGERQRARNWLEAASLQGVDGLVRAILELDRRTAMQQREALDLFRSVSARILRDPAVAAEARRVLAEELGRFQEFQPLLIDLQSRPELEPEEPAIETIRERARYLADVAANFARVCPSERAGQLAQIQAEYAACLSKLEHASESLAALEKRAYSVLSHSITFA